MASDRETNLEMAMRHVAEGEGKVAAQKAIIARLKSYKLASGQAEMLLRLLEDCLEGMIVHKHLIEAEIALSRELKQRKEKNSRTAEQRFPIDPKTPAYWLTRAEEVRALGNAMRDERSRRSMFRIANSFEDVARRAD